MLEQSTLPDPRFQILNARPSEVTVLTPENKEVCRFSVQMESVHIYILYNSKVFLPNLQAFIQQRAWTCAWKSVVRTIKEHHYCLT